MSNSAPATRLLRYEEIAGDLRQQIVRGALQPDDRLPTIRALRSEYATTQATVERALDILEQDALIVRTERSGVYVASPGRKPATGLIGLCGVSFNENHFSPYWMQLICGIEEGAQQADAQIVLLKGDSASGWDKVDGLLVNPGDAIVPVKYLPPQLPLVGFFEPVAFAGNERECAKALHNVSIVLSDDYSGIYEATKHLIQLGHRRIAYLHNARPSPITYGRRLAGYRDALSEAGITPDENWMRCLPMPSPFLYFMNTGREAMKHWLREDWRELGCTALLAHNDDTAWGALEAFREAGIDVPGQVSIVGYDGTQSAECCTPPLTTVDVPLRRMGQAGVELLMQKIKGHGSQPEVVLPSQLRVRTSTAPVNKRRVGK